MKKQINLLTNLLMIGLSVFTAYQTYTAFNWQWLLSFVVSLAGTLGTMATAYKWRYAGLPNMVQNVSNFIVSVGAGIYGDAIMAGYYFLMESLSLKTWGEHSKSDGTITVDKTVNWLKVAVLVAITGLGLGCLSFILGGQAIVLDALNNATGAVAQYMQKVERKRASWYLWLATNLMGIVIWLSVDNVQLAVMYGIFTLNSVRGLMNWSE